jgi:hypothetical protein
MPNLSRLFSPRRVVGVTAAALMLAVAVPVAANAIPVPPPGGGDPPPRTTTTRRPTTTTTRVPGPPRYKVEAISFKVDDESGVDWLGSDEPLWVFNSSSPQGDRTVTKEFEDADSGDLINFPAGTCLVADCSAGVEGPIAVQTTLVETDLFGDSGQSVGSEISKFVSTVCPITGGYKAECMFGGQAVAYIVGLLGNDLIQTTTIAWPISDLSSMYVGQASDESISLSDGDARYRFNFRTTRLS